MPRRALRPAALFLAVLVLSTAWLAFRALQIRDGLLGAREQLTAASEQLLQGDAAVLAGRSVAKARRAADDPVWRLAAAVPVVGDTFAAAVDATDAAALLVDDVLPAAQTAVDMVRERPPLRDGRVDLGVLGDLEPLVTRAAVASGQARAAAVRTDPDRLPTVVQELRAQLVEQTAALDEGLRNARTGLELAPDMLGADEPRRWFVAVMNNAEARGSGGLVGAYLVVLIEDGQILREAVGTNNELRAAPAPVVDLGPEFSAIYDRGLSRQAWQAAVETPHWPSAAAIMAGLWQAQSGDEVHGVIGIDPLVMEAVLSVTGPVTTAGGRTLSSEDVADYVFRGEYEEFRDRPDADRRQVLSGLAAVIYDAVLGADYPPLAMGRALAATAETGHLQLWSAVPEEHDVLEDLRLGGTLADVDGAYLQVVMNNASGNKADVYVRRAVMYRRHDDGTAEVSVTLTNTVDPAAVAPVVIGRVDGVVAAPAPGATRLRVSLYVGRGQDVRGMRVNGAPVPFESGVEQGHGFGSVVVEVLVSSPVTVTAEVTDPGGPLLYRQQPLAVPDELDFAVPHTVG